MLSLWLLLPFGGLLFSMAFIPLIASEVWHKFMPAIVAFWIVLLVALWSQAVPFTSIFASIAHTFLHEYIPFVVLLTTLYVISGGIWIEIQAPPHPWLNVCLLGLGTFLAGWIGTMGASMILIRPFLSLNRERVYRMHLIVFFIFLVSNIGGGLTPLGDPPLLMGFLAGIDFFWPFYHLWKPLVSTTLLLLVLFAILESVLWYYEMRHLSPRRSFQIPGFHIRGYRNFLFLLATVLTMMMEGLLGKSSWSVGAVTLFWFEGAGEILLVLWALLSWIVTAPSIREHNHFTWEPVREVAFLFLGLFITLIPATEILHTQGLGSFQQVLKHSDGTWNPFAIFWASGLLSAFLDNAPTYLLFFHVTGGDPGVLMGRDAMVLKAFSLGSVFMGALTYIGNAPNMMVRSLAMRRHMPVPSFFGYLGYSIVILGIVFYIVSKLIFF